MGNNQLDRIGGRGMNIVANIRNLLSAARADLHRYPSNAQQQVDALILDIGTEVDALERSIASLVTAQAVALGTADVAALTTAQIVGLATAQIAPTVTTEQIAQALTTTQVTQGVTTAQIAQALNTAG
jgi:hypothetical protein